MRRLAVVLLLIAAACGGGDGDGGTTRRVTTSPDATAGAEVVPSPSVTPSAASPRARTARPSTGRPAASADDRPVATTTRPAPSFANARIKLTRIASLAQPLALAVRKGDTALYVAEKGGRVRAVRGGDTSTVLDISGQVSTGSEQGLLGIAFSPDGRYLYVNFTNTAGDTRVREYSFTTGRGTAPRDVLAVDQPYANHNGGNLAFGRDGHLYIGLGDGGSGGDPQGHAQNLESLLGKMLRISPRPSGTRAYGIPSGNPFVGRAGRDEIWAYGLRNPFRYSFDRSTGDLWTGDVGQNAWEEIDFQPAGRGGLNYGWNRYEGSHIFLAGGLSNHTPPIYEYPNGSQGCAVTGGYVYRGSRIHDLRGAYLFADFCEGRLRGFVRSGSRATGHRFLGPQLDNLSSFGEDASGELYVLSLGGGVFRIDPA